ANGSAFGGSAIGNFGTLSATNCTFSGNVSTGAGSGGGAIANTFGIVTVTNSTFSGNSASNVGGFRTSGGAIDNFEGTLTVTNSTFSGNSGGAIVSDSSPSLVTTVTVVNSILVSSTGGNCVSNGGPITDGGHNIDDGTTCGFGGTNCAYCVGGDFPGRGCVADSDCTGTPPTANGTCTAATGTSFCNTNPLLDPAGLASIGGPTQTIALEAGRPAINAGDETVCAAQPGNNIDQRGFLRH